jgi:hypothetical protein
MCPFELPFIGDFQLLRIVTFDYHRVTGMIIPNMFETCCEAISKFETSNQKSDFMWI